MAVGCKTALASSGWDWLWVFEVGLVAGVAVECSSGKTRSTCVPRLIQKQNLIVQVFRESCVTGESASSKEEELEELGGGGAARRRLGHDDDDKRLINPVRALTL